MRVVWIIAGAGWVFASSIGWAAADTGNSVRAVWKEQHIHFLYMGRTSRYSCDGLRDKIRAMLLDLGARRDLRITTVGCDYSAPTARMRSSGPDIGLVFAAPALPGTAARQPRPGDPDSVDARFEPFTITRDPFRNMDIGDCELVEEFARQVLPKLTTRGVKEDITCVPNQLSGSRFLVKGEILRPLPRSERRSTQEKATLP